jgi:exosome complex component CSL4
MEGTFVVPGDVLDSTDEYGVGHGAYRSSDGITRASLVGKVVIDQSTTGTNGVTVNRRMTINVVNKDLIPLDDLVLTVGDKVLCRVIRINAYQAYVDILTVGDQVLQYIAKGLIRREDIRSKEVDQVIVRDFFRGGDIVRAVVISLGDSKHYFLSTSSAEAHGSNLGVVLRSPDDVMDTA